MINVVKENTGYYFPIDKVPASNEFILELYSELSLSTITFEDLSGEVQDDYVSIVITTEMCEQVNNGEYNYTLYDNTDGEKISIGLIRFDLEEGGQTDDEEYVVYQDDFDGYVQAIELTTTAFTENGVYEAQDKGWHEVTVNIDTDWYYTSGYTDGYSSGYTDGYTDAIEERPLTSIAISKNGAYIAEKGGYSGITVDVQAPNYVTFTAQANNSSVGLLKLSAYQQLWYSTDTINWNVMTTGTTITLTNSGDTCYMRGILSHNTELHYTQFKMTGKIAASGNCNYLWNYQNPNGELLQYCGYNMFKGCTSLTTAPELPTASEIYSRGYYAMFSGCTSLTTAPALPATTVSSYSYAYMFAGCTSLTTAPELPAKGLSVNCYSYMFAGCTNLVNAPSILPAMKLEESCYLLMFSGCTSLTTAPALPATSIAKYCYQAMFNRCTNLVNVPQILPATTLATSCYQDMFYGCTNLRTAPTLPATTISSNNYAYNCYSEMFRGCTNLNYVKCYASTVYATTWKTNWLYGVAATGTFVRNNGVTWWERGTSGIPTNWTVKVDNVPESALS